VSNIKIERLKLSINKITYRLRIEIIYWLCQQGIFFQHFIKLLSNKTYHIFKFTSINSIKSIILKRIQILSTQSNFVHYCAPLFSDYTFIDTKNNENDFILETYVASIDSVKIIGGSNLILIDNSYAIYELKDIDKKKTTKFSDQGIRFYDDSKCMVSIDETGVTFENGIILSGNFTWNYYHLLFEFIVKFEILNKTSIDKSIPILIDKICIETSQYSQLINIFNIDNRKIIPIEKGKMYSLKKGFHISCPNLIPPDILKPQLLKPDDLLFNLNSLKFLRETLLPLKSDLVTPKRIFLSRSNASKRRKFNESEVFELLKKYNFEMVFPENYSIIEQIAIFNNAEFIIGGSGAALTNVIFCNVNCKILVLVNSYIPFSGFSTLADYVHAKMIYVTGDTIKVDKIKSLHESFILNPKKIEQTLLNLL